MKDVTIVVGTIGQSIMRSEDNGQTWARIGPRRGFAYEASVRCIAMHPKQHNILFAGTERGLYRSEDRGANWKYLDSALNPHYIWAIGIDPVNPDNMFVGTGTPTPAMLFRSKDGGQSWEKRPVEVATECEAVGTPRFTGIAVDPLEPNHIWAGLEVDGARHSSDGGDTWSIVDVTGTARHSQRRRDRRPAEDGFHHGQPGDLREHGQRPKLGAAQHAEIPALGVSAKGKLSARHRSGSGESEKNLVELRRLHTGNVGRDRAIGRLLQELEAAAAAGGTELDDVDVRDEFRRSEYDVCREPLRLSLPQRRRRRLVDEAAQRAERDRGGVLVAELTRRFIPQRRQGAK